MEMTSVSNAYIQLPKSTTVAKGSPVPPMWFEPIAEDGTLDSTCIVNIYKTPRSILKIMNELYDITEQDASPDKNLV